MKKYINENDYAVYHYTGKKIPLETINDDNSDIDIIVIKNQKACENFEEIFDLGLYPKKPGIYCYDYNNDHWSEATEFINDYEKDVNFGIYKTIKEITGKRV